MKNSGKLSIAQGGEAISMNDQTISKEEKQKAIDLHNDTIEIYSDVVNDKVSKSLKEAAELKSDLTKTEIKPFGNYVLVKPYDRIPYQAMEQTDSGLLIDKTSGRGYNPNSGEIEDQEQFSRVGVVVEVNPTCTMIKPGDDIYYRKAQGVPIPFMGQGFEVVSEHSIQAIVGYKLTERWSE